MKSRLSAAVLTLGVLATLAPMTARAEHCDSRVIIFSSPGLNSNALTCSIAEHDADSRLINPGSTSVTMAYTLLDSAVCTPGTDKMFGEFNGLGLIAKRVTLSCIHDETLGYYRFEQANSTAISRTAMGCLTATVLDEEELEANGAYPSNSFHTIDTVSCPGGGF